MKHSIIINKIDIYYKLCNGVSNSFNILNLTPIIDDITDITNKRSFNKKAGIKFIIDTFNRMVAKYLNMQDIHTLYYNNNNNKYDSLGNLIHDLIHEAIREGSVKSFKEKDKLRPTTPYSKLYDIQDFINEDIAQSLSGDNSLSAGLTEYFYHFIERIDINNIKDIDSLIIEIQKILEQDLYKINNQKQKQYILSLKKSLFYYINTNNYIKEKINKLNNYTDTERYFEFKSIFNHISEFVKEYNDVKLNLFSNRDKEKISIIDNERIASLLRRWLLFLKQRLINYK